MSTLVFGLVLWFCFFLLFFFSFWKTLAVSKVPNNPRTTQEGFSYAPRQPAHEGNTQNSKTLHPFSTHAPEPPGELSRHRAPFARPLLQQGSQEDASLGGCQVPRQGQSPKKKVGE